MVLLQQSHGDGHTVNDILLFQLTEGTFAATPVEIELHREVICQQVAQNSPCSVLDACATNDTKKGNL